MKTVWYIGQVIEYDNGSWELQGIFDDISNAIENMKNGEFCAKTEFGIRLSDESEYPKESYWKIDGKIYPSESNY